MKIGPIELSFSKKGVEAQKDDIQGFTLSEMEQNLSQQHTQPSEEAAKQTKAGNEPGSQIKASEYRSGYLNYGLLFKAINIRAAYLLGNGYEIYPHPKDRSQKNAKICEDFLEKTGMNGYKLQRLSINTDVYGTGHLELVENGNGDIIDLVLVNPESMDLMRSGFDERRGHHNPSAPILFNKSGPRAGEPKAWIQSYSDQGVTKWQEIPWESIAFLRFNVLGDRWLGVSLVQPIIKDIQRIMNISEGYAEAAFRHGFPKMKIKYGRPADAYNPEIRPTPQMKENAEKMAKLMSQKDVVISPYYYESEMNSPKITKVNLITEYFIDVVVATTGVPRNVLLGTAEDANFAAVRELNKLFATDIKNRQRIVTDMFRRQIFPRILPEGSLIPEVRWKEIHEDEDREKVKMIYTLFQPPGAPEGIITREEARIMLKEIMPLPGEDKIKEEQDFMDKNFPKEDFNEKTEEQKEEEQQQKQNERKKASNRPSGTGKRNPIGDGTRSRREAKQR